MNDKPDIKGARTVKELAGYLDKMYDHAIVFDLRIKALKVSVKSLQKQQTFTNILLVAIFATALATLFK